MDGHMQRREPGSQVDTHPHRVHLLRGARRPCAAALFKHTMVAFDRHLYVFAPTTPSPNGCTAMTRTSRPGRSSSPARIAR